MSTTQLSSSGPLTTRETRPPSQGALAQDEEEYSVIELSGSRRRDHEVIARWRELARERKAEPFLRPEMFLLELPLLGGGQPMLAVARRGEHFTAVIPLVRRGTNLESWSCDHTPRYDYLGDPSSLAGLWRTLRDDRRWQTIVLDRVPVTSALAVHLPHLALRDLCVATINPGARSPHFMLAGHEARLTSKLKHNLRRCKKRLGDVELERITSFSREALDAGFALEGSGWKDADGTSIASHRELAHFYRALGRLAARRGELALYFLRANGRRVAFVYALEDGESLFALKTGYDPAFADASPGQVLFGEIANDAEKRGLLDLDFMGHLDEWKRRWTEQTHDQVTIIVYRPTLRSATDLVRRELIEPRLSETAHARIEAVKAEIARHRQHCQQNDLIGVHSPIERVVGKVRGGLGIRSGVRRIVKTAANAPVKPRVGSSSKFAPGSWVRVRSKEDVDKTLDEHKKLRGLVYVPAQFATCGRVYRVDRRVRRIRDDAGQLRPVSGTVLLEGVTCDGHGEGLGCGRHCPLMYRDEWLEPADPPPEAARESVEVSAWARVKTVAEIEATLDEHRQRDGVTFMAEMARFAGQRLPVVRRLERVFEIDRWTPPRGPVYLLEGAFCVGRELGDEGPCDRACALLWHGDWLTLES